jgi:RHH-type transcriptional regulator, rel operon repressor / antitoxin RelB
MATVTVTLNPDEKALLDQIAGIQSRSEEELAAEALREYLKFEAEQIRRIQEGVAAADRGEFATDEEVQAFFAKYADPQ